MTHTAHDHEYRGTPDEAGAPMSSRVTLEAPTPRTVSSHAPRGQFRALLATALIVAAGALAASVPARADSDAGPDARSDDWSGDHDGIYQVQRGDLVCGSREACGGPAAIPMARPGYWYLPGGTLRAGSRR
jgi:hypothetical protein